MKNYIVKRIDGQFLVISERDIDSTMGTEKWDGTRFVKQFTLIGEEKDRSGEMAALFDDVEIKPEPVVEAKKPRGRPKA